jgi:hypothetical protein
MTTRDDQDALGRLIREAADEVQPRPALDAIRARTSPKETPMSVARTWLLGGLGGAVATAAVIGGVWFATANDDDPVDPGPVDTPSQTVTPAPDVTASTTPAPGPSESETAGSAVSVPAYYAGEPPAGLALYREFVYVPENDKIAGAVRAAANGDPKDPDYRSLWPKVAILSAHRSATSPATV